MATHRIFSMKFSSVYPLYVQKAARKGRTKEEVDRIICWLTGYSGAALNRQLKKECDFTTFFAEARRAMRGLGMSASAVPSSARVPSCAFFSSPR